MKWLVPGMNVKRWLVLLFLGVVGFSLATGLIMLFILRSVRPRGTASTALATATLQFIPRTERAGLLIVLGLAIVIASLVKLSGSLLSVFLPAPGSNVAEVIYRRRKLPRGPRIVAIGGGTGLSVLLKGLKEYTSNLTAIVTVASDGAGDPLQRELGVLPPGDFGSSIIALSDEEPLMERLFQYRFGNGSGLDGHSFGSLFIAALSHITGSFERALREVGRVLAVRGQILPSTLSEVRLVVDADAGQHDGQPADVPHARLVPEDVVAYPEATRAILDADMVVLGPGSIYTSLLPNLLVPGIREALRSSRALKVFVSNVATQANIPAGEDVLQHVRLVRSHVGDGLFDYVVVNDNLDAALPLELTAALVRCHGATPADLRELRLVEMDIIDPANAMRHHSAKLGEGLLKLYYDQAPRRSRSEVVLSQPAIAAKTA
ncbi:MAG: YvcK family protein [Chloroflexota bacterium]|nr:YvcK family protein [Chloroflexota bacterium]